GLLIRLFDVALGQSQDVALDVHRQKVDLWVLHRLLRHKAALAAAQLQVQRLPLWEQLVPVADVVFRVVYAKWAGRQLRARPGFSSDSHTMPPTIFSKTIIAQNCRRDKPYFPSPPVPAKIL